MANLEKLQSYKLICEGGLNSSQNYLMLSDKFPGVASTLINFEPSLFGGYRRINGFAPLELTNNVVDATNGTGGILSVSVYNQGVIATRAQTAGAVYKIYAWVPGNAWSPFTTGLTLTSTGVTKIRTETFNFGGKESIAFVDGVNNATIYNTVSWGHISPSGTGVDYPNAGGNQALINPKYVCQFKNTLFVSGDSANPQIVAYSAPNAEYNWTVASGGGQINIGFTVKQIKPFRDELYVFGETKIRKIVVSGTNFVAQDVTNAIGCIASDSVQEINGDLQFLSQDGFRTIAGTNRIGDVELAVLSKDIQQDVTDLIAQADLPSINSVLVRRKSQIRYFFSSPSLDVTKSTGILGAVRAGPNGLAYGVTWDWSKLLGIRTSCCGSGYVNGQEYVLHGDFNGKVYRQEIGNSFDGANILAVYTTPYLDFGESQIRKTLHRVAVFLRAEGVMTLSTAIQYDWNSLYVLNPTTYIIEGTVAGTVYGTAVYGTSAYATSVSPVLVSQIEGSGFSNRITFSSNDMNAPYSIQGIVYEYAIDGRK